MIASSLTTSKASNFAQFAQWFNFMFLLASRFKRLVQVKFIAAFATTVALKAIGTVSKAF